MFSRIRNSLNVGIAAIVVGVAAVTLVPADASAFGAGGLGHIGGLGHSGGLGHMGGLGHAGNLGRAGSHNLGRFASKAPGLKAAKHASHTSIAKGSDRITRTHAKNGDRPVGGKMYERAGTGTAENGDRPVGGKMYEKTGTGRAENGDRPVGNGMYERADNGKTEHGTHHEHGDHSDHDDWRVDIVPIPVPPPLVPFDPGQVSVSYGSTAEVGLVRVDDLPQNVNRVQSNCDLLQAKIAHLMNNLARQNRVLAGLQGAKNVAYSGTATGVSTSFATPEDAQWVIDRLQRDIDDTQQLLARYQIDLARCLAAGN